MDPRIAAVRKRCTRWLSHHGPEAESPRRALAALALEVPEDAEPDRYGEGALLAELEAEVAALLGKSASVFMPSGTMAQQIALRVACERRGVRHVAFHPRCHLEVHEHRGYERLHGLSATLVGNPQRMMTPADVAAITERLGALLVELPQRDLGGELPTWEGLHDLVGAARDRGAHVHLDGARLWECGPFYARPYAEIAGLFDSVYVSFYKGLGGIAGCALAGTEELVREARVWQRRHGGCLVSQYPYAVAARAALRERLPRMPRYVERARSAAARFARIEGVSVRPVPPPTNMFHVVLPGDADRLVAAALDVAEASGVWLFGKLSPTPELRRSSFEVSIGDAALELEDDLLEALLRQVISAAA